MNKEEIIKYCFTRRYNKRLLHRKIHRMRRYNEADEYLTETEEEIDDTGYRTTSVQ